MCGGMPCDRMPHIRKPTYTQQFNATLFLLRVQQVLLVLIKIKRHCLKIGGGTIYGGGWGEGGEGGWES